MFTNLDFAKFSKTFSGTPTFGPFISAGKILILDFTKQKEIYVI